MCLSCCHCLANRVKVALELTKLTVPIIMCSSDYISKLIVKLLSLLSLCVTKGDSYFITMSFDRTINEGLHISRNFLIECSNSVYKFCIEVLVLLSLTLLELVLHHNLAIVQLSLLSVS